MEIDYVLQQIQNDLFQGIPDRPAPERLRYLDRRHSDVTDQKPHGDIAWFCEPHLNTQTAPVVSIADWFIVVDNQMLRDVTHCLIAAKKQEAQQLHVLLGYPHQREMPFPMGVASRDLDFEGPPIRIW